MRLTPPRSAGMAQRGLGLVELLIATALASILLGSLFGVTLGGLQAQSAGRERNEMVHEARFALGLIVARAEATPPKILGAAPPNSSGDWFGPTMYCLKTPSRELIETTTADSGCSGSRVLAANVTAFAVQRPAGLGAVDRPAATIVLTVADASGRQALTLAATVRLGGAEL